MSNGIILTSHDEPTGDAVLENLRAFLVTAQSSESHYTLAQLQEMVETELLGESINFVSWIKRTITGVDESLVDEMRTALDEMRTTEQRNELLQTIDSLLKEATVLQGRGMGKLALSAIGGATLTNMSGLVGGAAAIPGTLLGSMLGGLTGVGIKQGTKLGASLSFKAGKYGAMAFGAMAVLKALGTIYVQKSGTLDEYVGALKALRVEVENKQL